MLNVIGYDWNNGINYEQLLSIYKYSGFQATNFGLSVDQINKMVRQLEQPYLLNNCLIINLYQLDEKEKPFEEDIYEEDEFIKRRSNCTIFLGYTSNMVSCGNRDSIRFIVQHKMVDCIVTTAGGVEEDLIKCLAPTFIGDFQLKGSTLREDGLNRIGNLLVPNNNYCEFENWVMPILDKMLEEQVSVEFICRKFNNYRFNLLQNIAWTPSAIIERLGIEINDEQSICYWAAKNKIPIFCPALTDGSLGDMMYFHSFRNPGLVIDILKGKL